MRFLLTICAYLSLACLAFSQSATLSNSDVIELSKAGLSSAIIVDKVLTAPTTSFDTSVEGLKSLKAAGVADEVIRAMIAPRENKSGRKTDELTSSFKKLQNAVVTVWSELGRGTGFFISRDGLILTNQHV